ncbi:MAG: response regulator transcription factor [Clostridia bacterium]|nr:response regulator transcription factor [Clostridia bacterium]MBR5044862.1 response regulator transcription factor [Clostridia bacterium]
MIYLLEDDDSIRKLVVYALESQGFEAEGFSSPAAFWDALKNRLPDLLLLDIMLPGEDGMTILGKLRQSSRTKALPVIMLTAKNTEFDLVRGLDGGADDYISKPFGMMELIARIRAVLRRFEKTDAVREYRAGPLYLCPDRHEVLVGGKPVDLTYKEYSLLCLFFENRGIVLTRSQLMDRVWGLEAEYENRTLDVHIRTLRAKLGDAGSLIETVRGFGYRMIGETNDR